MLHKAKTYVLDWYKEHNISDIQLSDIYIVWFCKTLQNWKALVSTDLPDGRYFEVTYNGDKNETYVDAYEKKENKVIKG